MKYYIFSQAVFLIILCLISTLKEVLTSNALLLNIKVVDIILLVTFFIMFFVMVFIQGYLRAACNIETRFIYIVSIVAICFYSVYDIIMLKLLN